MASASQKKMDFLTQKLRFLKVQGDQLNSDVGEYVNGLIEAGESWTEGGDTHMGYMELCQIIDTAVVFLCEKCEELSANKPLQSSCKVSAATSLSHTARTSPTSSRESNVSVPPKDKIQVTADLARIAVIEDALCFFRGNLEKVAEQQTGFDQQLKEILSKLTESDQKNNSRFRQMKEQVKEQINEINEKQVSLDQEHETRLHNLEKQIQKLSTTQYRMKVEMESQAELRDKFVHIPDQLEGLKEKLDVLEARIDRIVDDCSNKEQELKNVTRDLADSAMANTGTYKVMSKSQHKETNLLQELETRLQTLKADSERNVNVMKKKVEKAEANFRILCQMLNDRLNPLEKLRTSFNERAIIRNENIRKLFQVIREVADMSPRLQQLELKSTRTRCGFTAWAKLNGRVPGETINEYVTTFANVGGNFNAGSGIFTAPVDGLYVATVSLTLKKNIVVEVIIRHKEQGQSQGSGVVVCSGLSTVKDTTVCNMGIVDMKAGGILFLDLEEQKTCCYNDVWFSCFLIA